VSDLIEMMPFAVRLGVVLDGARQDEVAAHLEWAPERCTAAGVMHGGAQTALADTTGAVCAFLNLPEGATTATLESKTNFFRAVREGTVRAVSRPLHRGRSTVVVQTELHDDGGRRVAHVIQTQQVLGG
jgi:uncharacterized protein (TIGR00369 family)